MRLAGAKPVLGSAASITVGREADPMQADRQPVAAVSVAGQWASCPPQPASSVCSAGTIGDPPPRGTAPTAFPERR